MNRDVDIFDDGSSVLVSNAHLENMKATVMQYSEQLRTIEYALTQSLTEHWDPNRECGSLSVCFLFLFFVCLHVTCGALRRRCWQHSRPHRD